MKGAARQHLTSTTDASLTSVRTWVHSAYVGRTRMVGMNWDSVRAALTTDVISFCQDSETKRQGTRCTYYSTSVAGGILPRRLLSEFTEHNKIIIYFSSPLAAWQDESDARYLRVAQIREGKMMFCFAPNEFFLSFSSIFSNFHDSFICTHSVRWVKSGSFTSITIDSTWPVGRSRGL